MAITSHSWRLLYPIFQQIPANRIVSKSDQRIFTIWVELVSLVWEASKLLDPKQILSIIPDPVICLNEHLIITYANDRAPESFGYSLDELDGEPIDLLVPDKLQTDFIQRVKRRLVKFVGSPTEVWDTPIKFEYAVRRQNGDTFPAEITIGRLKKDGSTLIILIFHDLTPRIKRQEAHQELTASFKAVVQASPLAIYSIDRKGHLWMWNPAAERIFGWKREEVIGRTLPTIPEDELQKYESIVHKSFQGEYISGEEVKRKRKDGRLIDVNVFTAPLHDTSGEIVGLMAVLEDITARKAAERQLRALNEQLAEFNQTLEQRVKERTEEAERRAIELARSNAELEQFAYVASHDLQEPLRMVASYTKLLARRYSGRLDEDADEFIAYAVNGATRMQQLIDDLLTYSRLGTRGKPFNRVDCKEVIDQVLETLRTTISECEADVVVGPMPTLLADASQLTQLFQNLITNALKFRSSEKPRVNITSEKKNGEWLFTVQDNGIGIEPAYAEKIFEIFQRLHTRAEYPGTGIGLAIAKKIVERHGGHIWLDTSNQGPGTVFRFTISTNEETQTVDPVNT